MYKIVNKVVKNGLRIGSIILCIAVAIALMVLPFKLADSPLLIGLGFLLSFFPLYFSFVFMNLSVFKKHRKVCFFYKTSIFSSKLETGVKEVFAKSVNYSVISKPVPKEESASDYEKALTDFLLSDEANNFDGFILRTADLSDNTKNAIDKLLIKNKKFVLLDVVVNAKGLQFSQSKNVPYFVGSDFSSGGIQVADFINKKISLYNKESTCVILLLGPYSRSSSRKRSKNIVWGICENNNIDICKFLFLENFHTINAVNKLKDFLNDNPSLDLEGKNLIVFCANDTIACSIMKLLKNNSPDFRKMSYASSITFIGYDGIKSDEGLEMSKYNYSFATINVDSENQGKIAAESVIKMLSGLPLPNRFGYYLEPELIIGGDRFENQ